MSIVWKSYPLSDIYYRSLPVTVDNKLKFIVTIDDVDIVVMQTLRDRIRFKKEGDSNFLIVPVIFYNENDRLKTMKQSPFIILTPQVPGEVKDYILTDTQKQIPVDNPDDVVQYNNAATWYEMGYTITIGCDEWSLYRRLCSFIKDGLFGLKYGQRRIQTNDEDGDTHYREIIFTAENKSEDFERNYFQYDLDIQFRILLNVNEWTDVPRITDVEFTIKNETALNVNGKQIIPESIIDVNQPRGFINKK